MATKIKRATVKRSTTKSAAKPAASKSNGSAAKRTGAVTKITAEVTSIAKALAGGATMKSMKEKYGVSDDGPIRSALYRAGFDSKGKKHGVAANSINAKNATGKKQVVKLRSEGAAWYALAFQTGLPESEVKAIVADAGGPTGRVYGSKESGGR